MRAIDPGSVELLGHRVPWPVAVAGVAVLVASAAVAALMTVDRPSFRAARRR